MLNRSEQRRLRALERSLEHDDPELAQRLRNAEWKRPSQRVNRHLAMVTGGGLVVALFGLVLGAPIFLLGLAVAVGGFWSRLMLNWGGEPGDRNGGDGSGRLG
nr:DUF3040 domain-containing protein [Kibdelosporangium sp. MJ126-NF4]CEL17523.1 hypothetical protein [Kibdelosporangium sp. MJ126-NF4]CTQ91251.1 hypothetical protein [Kibdelosporangium sp. MJ126-NF4]